MPDARSDVGRYYDRNTRRFLNLGHGGAQKAIRRAVWGPAVASRTDAIEYVNALILGELLRSDAGFVLDLGCGVGGSIHYLSNNHPARYVGATISGTQARMGKAFLKESGIPDASIVQADFTADEFARSLSGPADLAFAVESFIHVERMPERLAAIAQLIKPGGKLILCDDMLARKHTESEGRPREARWLREFRAGWHAAGLESIDVIVGAAAAAGLRLEEIRDLTPYLELDRTRDIAARVFMSLVRWSPLRPPWFANLLGGNALQLCLKNGIIRYMFAVFTRTE
jgi:SAM-dependent methyltransferase